MDIPTTACDTSLNLVNLKPDALKRSLGWRWELARALRDAGRNNDRARRDFFTGKVFQFQTELAECEDEWDIRDLDSRFPGLMEAFLLATETDDVTVTLRYELEARILARQSDEEISKRLSFCTPDTISWFEKVFFNVRDRLDNISWIVHTAIGPSLSASPNEREYAIFWKLIGYAWGPDGLNELISVIEHKHLAPGERTQSRYRDASQKKRDQAELFSTISLRPRSNQDRLMFAELQLRFRELEAASASGASTDSFLANIEECLQAVPWATGSRAAELLPQLAALAGAPAEPRAAELMMAAVHGAEKLVEQLSGFSFPKTKTPSAAEVMKQIGDATIDEGKKKGTIPELDEDDEE